MSLKPDEHRPNGLQITKDNEPNEILLRKQESIVNMMAVYFHEVGHQLAQSYSFKSGDVLTPREVTNTKIDIKPIQKLALFIADVRGKLNQNAELELKGLVKEIADSILKAYTKGKWDPNSINFQNASIEELEKKMKLDPHAPTYDINEQGKISYILTRQGRNLETPAYSITLMCMKILFNSYNQPYSWNIPPKSELKPSQQSSHERAYRLTSYLLNKVISRGEESDPNIPSDVDQAESIFEGAGKNYPSKDAHQEFLQKVVKKVKEFGIAEMALIIMNLRKKLIYDEPLNDIEASLLSNSYIALPYATDPSGKIEILNQRLSTETSKIFDQVYETFVDDLIAKYKLNEKLKPELQIEIEANVVACLKFGMKGRKKPAEVKKIVEKTVRDYAEAHQS